MADIYQSWKGCIPCHFHGGRVGWGILRSCEGCLMTGMRELDSLGGLDTGQSWKGWIPCHIHSGQMGWGVLVSWVGCLLAAMKELGWLGGCKCWKGWVVAEAGRGG
jgi:hypothetical protein